MKKALSIALTLVMIMSLCTVFAAADAGEAKLEGSGADVTFEVYGYYEDDATPDVISVDVAWGEMLFLYVGANADEVQLWDPATHSYGSGAELATDGWMPKTTGGDIVRVTNHSNVGVDVDVYADNIKTDVTMKLVEVGNETNNKTGARNALEFQLATGVGLEYANADYKEVKVVPGGSMVEENKTEIAQITVVVEKTV